MPHVGVYLSLPSSSDAMFSIALITMAKMTFPKTYQALSCSKALYHVLLQPGKHLSRPVPHYPAIIITAFLGPFIHYYFILFVPSYTHLNLQLPCLFVSFVFLSTTT